VVAGAKLFERPISNVLPAVERLVSPSPRLEMSETYEGDGEKCKKRNYKRREQNRGNPEQKCIQELVFNSASRKEQCKKQERENP
jgi:hypothetical protein